MYTTFVCTRVTLRVSAAIDVVACLSLTRRYCIETDKYIVKLFLDLLTPPLSFSNTTHGCEILTGRGVCHSGDLDFFYRSENS